MLPTDDQQALLNEAIGLDDPVHVELGYALYRKAVFPQNSGGSPDSVQRLLRGYGDIQREGPAGSSVDTRMATQIIPSDSVHIGDSLYNVAIGCGALWPEAFF